MVGALASLALSGHGGANGTPPRALPIAKATGATLSRRQPQHLSWTDVRNTTWYVANNQHSRNLNDPILCQDITTQGLDLDVKGICGYALSLLLLSFFNVTMWQGVDTSTSHIQLGWSTRIVIGKRADAVLPKFSEDFGDWLVEDGGKQMHWLHGLRDAAEPRFLLTLLWIGTEPFQRSWKIVVDTSTSVIRSASFKLLMDCISCVSPAYHQQVTPMSEA